MSMHQPICPQVRSCDALRGHLTAAALNAGHLPQAHANPIRQSVATAMEQLQSCAAHNGCGETPFVETAEGRIGC